MVSLLFLGSEVELSFKGTATSDDDEGVSVLGAIDDETPSSNVMFVNESGWTVDVITVEFSIVAVPFPTDGETLSIPSSKEI